MKASGYNARFRLPRDPYPGLRPFLDFEAALLFGRQRQVREVIDRLQQSQFVAVLGGSGSGKSSLVHAGVVPELRSFGIPGAGDLWLPLTTTPGTNVSAADRASGRRTPVTRLARRFAGLLQSRGSEEADTARVQDIAAVFRQEAGFARLLETYGGELDLPPGPDPAEARVLFVLDQFEELFHPTNKDVADAQCLVERVLDHFFNPHPRCHVVLTMRSEHLNDCAAFLELPDAINKSSYLIRRLDGDELREAIVGPAQRFLRLLARGDSSGRPLPQQVVFEPVVLQRLLHDVQAITHDPDHLPLLQHLLARLWDAALAREGAGTLVPATITEADLVCGVRAALHPGDESAKLPPTLPAELNTLRASVNNWPEVLHARHGAPDRACLDALFRLLAFKDPNTGLYSQQRVDVDEAAHKMGDGMTRAGLRVLLEEGFLGSVDYLFWDDEDPARTTLKVSHESFIRGWTRFRALVDLESVHFDEYLVVLRKCAEWVENQRSEDFLLETGEMRRLGGGFAVRLTQADKRERWSRLLTMDRDAHQLALAAPQVERFMQLSAKRLASRELRETRAARSARALVLITVVFALLPTALFSLLVQGPTMRRAELLFEAGNRANQALLSPSQEFIGDAAASLQSMLTAAALVDQARTGAGPWRVGVSKSVLNAAGPLPLFRDQRDFLENVFAQTEPTVNGTLRRLMPGALWRAAPLASAAQGVPLAPPVVSDGVRCQVTPALAVAAKGVGALAHVSQGPTGRLLVAAADGDADMNLPRRALFVPDRPTPGDALEILSASVDPNTGQCMPGAMVLTTPSALKSHVVVDASLRLLYQTAQGHGSTSSTLLVRELQWRGLVGSQHIAVLGGAQAAITDARAVQAVIEATGATRVAAAPTWQMPGTWVVDVAGRRWEVVNTQAQTLQLSTEQALQLVPLKPSPDGQACSRLAQSFKAMSDFELQVLQQDELCLRVAIEGTVAPGETFSQMPWREVRVAVHPIPTETTLDRAQENPPAPLASLLPFARVQAMAEGSDAQRWWWAGSGPLQGWLLMRSPAGNGGWRYIGTPVSTCALWRLGRRLQQNNPPASGRVKQPEGTYPVCAVG